MPLEYTTRQMGPVFFVTLTGTVELNAARHAYDRVLRACLASGCTAMLLDAGGACGELSTLERYDFGKHVAARHVAAEGELGQELRVALVARPPVADPTHFGALVANNRGGRFLVAAAVDEALRWFGVAPPPPPDPPASA